MKVIVNSLTTQRFVALIFLLSAVAWLTGCSSILPATAPHESGLATQTEQVEQLKSAEYQDYTTGMTFENSNQKLGNYYISKGTQLHHLIDQMEEGHQVSSNEINQALDNSNAEKYDNRPPVPLEDEIGNGY
jgi:hypothetical protein